MTPYPQTRTRTPRFYACHRHPTHPVTGFCALCLKDRLSGLHSSSPSLAVEKVVVSNRLTGDLSAPVPEFRRSKSVAGDVSKGLNDLVRDVRRNSCDVRVRKNTLSDLFVVDDTWKARDGVESMKLGFTNKEEEDDDGVDCGVRVTDDVIVRNEIDDDGDDEVLQGDLKTMKEIIDLELQNKKRNMFDSPSVFGQKLRKWRQKQKEKKLNRGVSNGGSENTQSEVADYGLGRRSCDTEPRFSVDVLHRLSVEEPRLSLDERRASWDGYMVARAIPRLTPMLSVVDNMMLGPVNRVTNVVENMQMHSIREDGGGYGQLNSDCCCSNRRSSSSSSGKTAGFGGGDDGKAAASNARVSPASDVVFQGTKLVITEKELKDWRLNSVKNNNKVESVSTAPDSTSETSVTNIVNQSNEQKTKVKPSRWRKVCNLWGHKQKLDDKKSLEHIAENRVDIGNSSTKHVRNSCSVNSRTRRDEFLLDRNRSTRYSTSDIDSGLLKLHLTPFLNSRRNKFGRSRATPSMVTSGF